MSIGLIALMDDIVGLAKVAAGDVTCGLPTVPDAVAGTVLRGQQPAGGARGNRVECVAGDRLHHLGEQIVGKAAEDVGDETAALLDFLKRLEREF